MRPGSGSSSASQSQLSTCKTWDVAKASFGLLQFGCPACWRLGLVRAKGLPSPLYPSTSPRQQEHPLGEAAQESSQGLEAQLSEGGKAHTRVPSRKQVPGNHLGGDLPGQKHRTQTNCEYLGG